MASFHSILLFTISSLLLLMASLTCEEEGRKVYIVYMGSLPREQQYSPTSHHVSLLRKVVGRSFSRNLVVKSYKRSFNGFAAKLTVREAQELSNMEGTVSVFPSRKLKLMTTRSWDFLHFNETVSRGPKAESDVIIGVIDTGIWPESASFSDEGFGPPPKKWNGGCKGGRNFTCNNKLIGARYYGSFKSARDEQGHGTHTASTAAGIAVKDTSFFGLAKGIARGGAPSARIAAYKVCDAVGCHSHDILAAFDDAISDGVDILSVSLGPQSPSPLYMDPISIATFHAMEKGILTSHSAGNAGEYDGVIGSIAPWLLTVAASSTDRRIIDKVVLGNGKTLVGRAVNSFSLNGTNFPLISGFEASGGVCGEISAWSCFQDCLNSSLAKGKILLCESSDGVNEALAVGALGTIYPGDTLDVSFVVPMPALALSSKDYTFVKNYVNSTENRKREPPVANILRSEATLDEKAPVAASFSSRGPNSELSQIMKPDVSAPGIDILAAFSPIALPSEFPSDKRRVKYNILSGTSMSCPHVSGIAAYIKSIHPDWSPSAIKSAIMTTATPMLPIASEFSYGSGHVNPVDATQPGLVYEAFKQDYIELICRSGIDTKDLRLITGDNSTCPQGGDKALIMDANYPSLTSQVKSNESFTLRFHRTVKNVGLANSTYKVEVSSTSKLKIKVEPQVLSFKSLNEKQSFNVTVSGKGLPERVVESTSLVWTDGTHRVRSPIVVHTHVLDIDHSH